MIRIDHLDFGYSKKKLLLNDINLELHRGNIHGILGKNGAGKTTLLKLMIGGLYPQSGTITIDDLDVTKRKVKLQQNVFFLPEEYQVPSITASQFLKANAVFYPRFSKEKFDKLLAEFGLSNNEKLSQLSLGSKKKFMLAFGLACQTQYLLLDEPTNGLDIPSKSQFRKIIASALTEEHTVIISTHQVRDLGQLLDTVIILDAGKIIFNQDIQNIERHLLFTKSLTALDNISSIYAEQVMGGHLYISANDKQEMTEAELEVLFNAISVNKEEILEQFKV